MLRAKNSLFSILLISAFSFSSKAAISLDQAKESCIFRFSYIFQDFAYKQNKNPKKQIIFFSKAEDQKLIANYSAYYKANDNTGVVNKKQKEILKDNFSILSKYVAKEINDCANNNVELSKNIEKNCPKLSSTNPEEKKNLETCTRKLARESSQKVGESTKKFFELLSSKNPIKDPAKK